MELFELVNNKVQIHPAAFTLKPFKDLWKQSNKTLATKELAYVFFFADYKSDFSDILNDEEKKKEIAKIVELPENWEPSDKVLAAVKFYQDRQKTTSMHLLESTMSFIKKLKEFYEKVDLNERDEKTNKLVHNIQQLQKGAAEIGHLTASLKDLKESVAKEIQEQSRIRGGGEVGMFEDPD